MPKVLVCSRCSNVVAVPGYPRTFDVGGKVHCGTCGYSLELQDLGDEARRRLSRSHEGWTWRTVLTFEVVFVLLALAAIGVGAFAQA